jgi:DNA polymerase III subunit delta'
VMTGASRMGKAFIIDEAEMMNPTTQNAILKTLEEPPEGTVIALVTSSEDRLLTTIRSRCQRVAFMPLSDQEMGAWIKSRDEFAAVKGAERDWLLRFAQGSPGAALSAIQHGLFAWQESLGPLLDTVGRGKFPPEMAGVMHKLIGEQAEAAVKQNPEASKDAANKAWMRRMLSFIAEDLRLRLRSQTAGKAADQVQEDAIAQRLLAAIDVVTRTEQQMYSNVNQQLLLENLVAQMCVEPVMV